MVNTIFIVVFFIESRLPIFHFILPLKHYTIDGRWEGVSSHQGVA